MCAFIIMPSVYCDVFNIMDATFFCTVREKTLKADPVIEVPCMHYRHAVFRE